MCIACCAAAQQHRPRSTRALAAVVAQPLLVTCVCCSASGQCSHSRCIMLHSMHSALHTRALSLCVVVCPSNRCKARPSSLYTNTPQCLSAAEERPLRSYQAAHTTPAPLRCYQSKNEYSRPDACTHARPHASQPARQPASQPARQPASQPASTVCWKCVRTYACTKHDGTGSTRGNKTSGLMGAASFDTRARGL
jgi:hypothetical protein